MTITHDQTEADRALKAKHRAMWALGDYPAVARDIVGDLGPVLVQASGVGPGERVLDVAAGSGNASIPAAAAGATVVASDLTPELFETGRKAAAQAGVEVDWQQADAEALPYPDASFDTVLSCLGVMFAPHHQAGADELVRVLRPGGTLGLLSWTPEGFIGQMFATMKPYAPAAAARGAAPAAVGQRGARPGPARRPRHRGVGVEGVPRGRRVRDAGRVPRLLQGQLRPDHRGLPGDRRRPGEGRRAGP